MIFIFYLKPVLWRNLHIINFIYPIRGRMPPKNTKKQKEDTAEMDVEIIDSLLPFEKLMAEKIDKLHGNKMNCDSILARKEKEKYFINKFKPELNSI